MKSQGLLQDRRFTTFLKVLAVGLALSLALPVFPIGGARGPIITTNLSTVTFSLVAFWIFFSVWLSIDPRDVSRQIWGFFAVGILLWAVAEAVWAYYEVILALETPYPSAADFFWVLGYLPLYLGLTARHKTLGVTLDPRRKLTILAFVAVLALITAYFVFSPIISEFDPQRLAESLLNVFYPAGDLVLLIVTSLVFFAMGEGRFSLTWRFILSGFILTSVADLLFSYLSWYDLYHPNGSANVVSILVDFAYNLSYVLLSLGIYAYDILLHLQRKLKLSLDSGALAESKILVFIDSKNRIISASANFMLLAGIKEKSQYEKRLFHDVLEVDEKTIVDLTHLLKEQGSINNYQLRVTNAESKGVSCTAIALFNPQNQYDGAGIVLQAELLAEETKEPPLSEEQELLVESFLKRAGARTNQDARTLKAYFLEQIRLIYSLVYEFNGQYVASGLLSFLAHTAKEEGWDIHVEGDEIFIPADYEEKILSTSLFRLLRAGRLYGGNVVSLSLIDEEMKRIDQEMKPDVLQIIDRHGLRIKNQAVF